MANRQHQAALAFSAASLKRDRVTNVTLVVPCQIFQALTFGGIALFLPLIRDDLQMSFAQGGMLSAAAPGTSLAVAAPRQRGYRSPTR